MPHSRKSQHKNKKVPSRLGEAGFTPLEVRPKLVQRLKYFKHRESCLLPKPKFVKSLTGFTLIEMLVSVGILTVILVAAVGIYVYAIGSQQKSTANANLQEDGQNILAMTSKDVRAMRIDYDYYPSGIIPAPTSTLALIDDYDSASVTRVVYRYKSTSQTIERCKQVGASCDSDAKFEAMNMSDVLIQRLDFYISPTSTPFVAGAATITSPRVTVIMDLGSQKERFGQKTIRLQQTLNPRYEEKE